MAISSTYEIHTRRWEECSQTCPRDLLAKKSVLTLIFFANIGALSYLFYYLSSHYSIPSEALFVAPFVSGVLAALVLLRLPTCGINSRNYSNLTNPALVLGQVIAALLFFPVVILKNYFDLNDYSDPYEVHKIKIELLENDFSEIIQNYSPRIDNLRRYGLLTEDIANDFIQYCTKYKQPIEDYLILVEEHPEIEGTEKIPQALQITLSDARASWAGIKEKLDLPEPELPIPSFSLCQRLHHSFARLFPNERSLKED